MFLMRSQRPLLRFTTFSNAGTNNRSYVTMRLLQIVSADNLPSVAVELDGDKLVDLCAGSKLIPRNLIDIIIGGKNVMDEVKRVAGNQETVVSRSSVRILAPVTRPGKVACVGMNYLNHCQELGITPPRVPVVFSKFPSSIIGPLDDILYPDGQSQALDWEAELAVIVGKTAKYVQAKNAMEHVFGYTVANDLSARDLFKPDFNGGQWLIGKSMDSFCPLGPVVVTKEEIEDPHNLNIICRVNGEIKQNGRTSDLIHKIPDIISYMTRYFTLHPGDVILTGTPSGVGHFRKPPEYLKVGDTVECEIEKIGKIKNKVVHQYNQVDYNEWLL